MKGLENIYPPITPLERATGCCPLIQAALMLDDLRKYFWEELPEDIADEVVQKAEIVFARDERMRRRFKGRRGRGWLVGFMQHWMSASLGKRNRWLARQLPGEYMFGGRPLPLLSLPRQQMASTGCLQLQSEISVQPLPKKSSAKKIRKRGSQPFSHYVHGCELLAA
jgi:hypothetical protein